MKSTLFALIILLLLSITNQSTADEQPLQGQAKIDSLLAELPNAKGDTNEVDLLSRLSLNLWSSNPDEGIKYGLKGAKLGKKIKWKKGQAFCFGSLGVCYSFGKSDYPKALEYYQKALKIFEEIGNKSGVARNLGNIGNIYWNQSNFPMALEYYQKSLKINEEIGNKGSISSSLVNIGAIYYNQMDYPKALEYYLKALKIDKEIDNKMQIAGGLANIGLVYRNQSDYPKALEYHLKSLKIFEEVGNKYGIAMNLNQIGAIYNAQSKYSMALEYYQKALKINEEIGNKKGLAFNYMSTAEAYLSISQDTTLSKITNESQNVNLDKEVNLNRSIKYSLQAEILFNELSALNELSSTYNNLQEAYYQKGMYKESIDAHRKHKELQDSIFNQENNDKIAALEKAREDDLKQKEIEKQKIRIVEQEKREQVILYFSIAIVVLMAVVMFVIYRLLKRSDKLLYNVLPVTIAKRLKNKEHPISDYFTQASIVFIDIVNFTEMAQDADPQNLVSNLNTIFTKYDTIAKKYGLEKIKTIGDSYMAAAGIPEVQKDNTHRAAQMALEVKELMKDYHTADGTKIDVRIGLDCGPVVAGVIGENKFIYDMWSDAVNTASRMESSSIAGEVHVSERFKEAVTEYEEFDYVERGEMEIKGKGKMKTFFIGERKAEVVS